MYKRQANEDIRVSLASEMNGFSYTEKDGRKCVYVNAIGEALYIYADVADDIIYGNFSPVKVLVDYYDEGHGTFTLGYDLSLIHILSGDFKCNKSAG